MPYYKLLVRLVSHLDQQLPSCWKLGEFFQLGTPHHACTVKSTAEGEDFSMILAFTHTVLPVR